MLMTMAPGDGVRTVAWGRAIRFLAGKVAIAALTVWVASVVVFAALNVLPSDPATAALGREATEAQKAVFRAAMGLDRPPLERYLDWAAGMIQGDFGISVISQNPVGPELMQRLWFTAVLGITALVISVLIALPLAVLAARRAGRPLDVSISSIAIAITAVPEFVIAIIVVLIGVSTLRLFPVSSGGIAQGDLRGFVLPVITLTLGAAAYVFRHARVSVLETMSAPYVRSAVLNGFSPRRILWLHVMPNAGVVVVNAVALNAITLLSGVIIVENVFGYPGLGQLLVQAIVANDFPKIEAVAVVTAALLVGVNLLADGVVLLLDPRLRTRVAARRA
jgi:peptide/nickel transport system permease protein